MDCSCADGQTCDGGGNQCVCEPQCDGRICGPDGCGGTCGPCGDEEFCTEGGRCEAVPAQCGDATCDAGESCLNCPGDCGQCCGDGACTDAQGEDCATCPADCGCPNGEACNAIAHACEAQCVPNCDGRDCGADGCGGTCGNGCPGDQACSDAGLCVELPAQCGDNTCDAGEDCATCPADCGQCCANGACADTENCATCPADCSCEDGERCDFERRACEAACQPTCDGRDCGADGCGGTCGDGCNGDLLCDADGQCVAPPAQCGDNACDNGEDCATCPADCGQCCGNGACGADENCAICPADCSCAAGEACDAEERACVEVCEPRCDGLSCGPDGCGGSCGRCDDGTNCEGGQCVLVCSPNCDGLSCGADGCGGVCGLCGAGEVCTAAGQCNDPSALCDCVDDEVCLDGFCRAPEQICSPDNPVGLCATGRDCLAGECVNRGNACTPQNPTGVCPLGELCRDGACAPFDGAALCDDTNSCTVDVFDQRANRCEHQPVDAACSDGNGCTANRCEAGVCLADPIPGCIEPPVIDAYATPTNVGAFVLAGTKPAGAAVEIDGQVAIPESPEMRWSANINLVPGENLFRVRSVDMGTQSAVVEVRVVYDIDPPTVNASPGGGVFLNPVSVTVAASEGATVYYTDDGGTPDRWSKSFRSAKQFRVFHDTELAFRALDDAGNWQEAITRYAFEITSERSRWTAGGALPEPLTLTTAEIIGNRLFLAAGTDGQAGQAGVHVYDLGSGEWSNGPALQIARAQLASVVIADRLYLIGGESDGLPLNLLQRMLADESGWENLAPMPSTRFGLTAINYGDRIYVMGGKTNGGAVLDVLEMYDVSENTWTNQLAQMPRPRFGHAALEHEGFIYVVGGEDEAGTPIAEVDVYEIGANEWVQAPDLPTPRTRLTLTKDLNRGEVNGPELGLVAAGGLTAGGQPSAVVEELVIARDLWRERTPLDAPRHSAAAVHGQRPASVDTLAQFGWVLGGQRAGDVTDSMVYYTRDQDYLRLLPELPEGRFMATAQEADGLIYLIGGRSFRETQDVWAYDPETGRTIDRAPLPQVQNGLGGAVIGGLIYAVGGANNFGLSVPWLHVYDPARDAWQALQPMPTARRDAAVVALEGQLWVIGGDNNGPLQTVEIYDPQTDEWVAGPVLPAGRAGARAIVHDGAIVLAFGRVEAGATNTALHFSNGRWTNYLNNCRECAAFEDGQMVLMHDHQLNVFGGRLGGQISDRIYSVNLSNQGDTPLIREASNLLHPVNYAAALTHHGRVYLLGGNDSAGEPGPGGLTSVQQINGRCFNGRADGGESAVDSLAGCPEVFPSDCRTYTVLSSIGRRITDPEGNVCDRNLDVGTWYRLMGGGGTQFVTSRPRTYNRCNTDAVGYMTGGHPSEAQGVVARNVCYSFIRDNCWTSARIQVRNCGAFYIYNFTQTPQSCSAAICTE